jgi:hypothetical protein
MQYGEKISDSGRNDPPGERINAPENQKTKRLLQSLDFAAAFFYYRVMTWCKQQFTF